MKLCVNDQLTDRRTERVIEKLHFPMTRLRTDIHALLFNALHLKQLSSMVHIYNINQDPMTIDPHKLHPLETRNIAGIPDPFQHVVHSHLPSSPYCLQAIIP